MILLSLILLATAIIIILRVFFWALSGQKEYKWKSNPLYTSDESTYDHGRISANRLLATIDKFNDIMQHCGSNCMSKIRVHS